jgi:hypothetical protein
MRFDLRISFSVKYRKKETLKSLVISPFSFSRKADYLLKSEQLYTLRTCIQKKIQSELAILFFSRQQVN